MASRTYFKKPCSLAVGTVEKLRAYDCYVLDKYDCVSMYRNLMLYSINRKQQFII